MFTHAIIKGRFAWTCEFVSVKILNKYERRIFMSEEIKEALGEEELEETAGGKKKHKEKKFDGPKCLECMKKGKMNIRTREHGNGTWECQEGHKFKGAGGRPNFEQPID